MTPEQKQRFKEALKAAREHATTSVGRDYIAVAEGVAERFRDLLTNQTNTEKEDQQLKGGIAALLEFVAQCKEVPKKEGEKKWITDGAYNP